MAILGREKVMTGLATTGLTVPQALNSAAIIALALYFCRDVLIPVVLAVLLAFVLAPLVALLQRARLGHALSVLVAVLLAMTVIGSIGLLVGNQAISLADGLPQYQATIQDKVKSLSVGGDFVERMAGSIQRLLTGEAPDRTVVETRPAPAFETPSTIVVVRTVLQPLLGPVATAGLVMVFAIFVLLYREDLRDRLVRLVGRRDLHRTILAMNEAARRLSRFFLIQLALATGFGTYVGCALWLAGLPSPFLWGLLAGAMRFVPFIGSAIGVIPPVLLAFAVSPGWGLTGIVLLIILGGDLVMGQVVEPLIYGHSTGLAPFAVILAAAFWAFLWGPIGLLLATPLTVCLVVVGRYVEPLAFMHVLLSDASPLDPEETFYQRALEGREDELLGQARTEIARSSQTEYFDRVALRGLGLAQTDLDRDALAFDRMEAVHGHIARMLAAIESPPVRPDAIPPDWTRPGTVLCIPARGPLDDLAATMAVQVFHSHGFGADALPNMALGSRHAELPSAGSVRLCCISALAGGSSSAGIRFFLRRLQRQVPGAAAVVCLWHAAGDNPVLAQLRAEGGEELIVLSLSELLALATAIANRGDPLPATIVSA